MMPAESVSISDAWESLRGDPMPWLLDEDRPNLHWRVLVELLRRPVSSPAVLRARGGADAAEPIASLLAELDPDGSWATGVGYWRPYSGPGWRIVAAVQLDITSVKSRPSINPLLSKSASGFQK